MIKYKEGALLDDKPVVMSSFLNLGIFVFSCPKCPATNFELQYNMTFKLMPRYCPYCGENLVEEEKDDTNDKKDKEISN